MRHQRGDIDAVRLRHDHQARRVLMVGFVAKILDHRQLLLLHLMRDLLLDLGAGHLERQRIDDDLAILDIIGRARPKTAGPGIVNLR
jgi:hypothetical protein